jgi:hypothetical protein
MVGTSVPLHELVGETPPAVILDLVSGLVTAALASGLDHFHPAQVRLGTGARVALAKWGDAPPHPVTSAPELSRTGPGEATLVYAAATSAVLAALPRLQPPPPDRDGHVAWVHDVEAKLRAHWTGQAGGDRTAMILAGCLVWDRAQRPGVRRLLEDLRSLALPAEEGLVRFTGACLPCMPGELPDRTPAPAPPLSLDLTPTYGRPTPKPRPMVAPNRTPSMSATPMAEVPQAVLPRGLAPLRSVAAPRRARTASAWASRLGITVGIGCALFAGMAVGTAVPRLLLAPEAVEPDRSLPMPSPDRVHAPPPALPQLRALEVRGPTAELAPEAGPPAPEIPDRAVETEAPPVAPAAEAPAEAEPTGDAPQPERPRRTRFRLPGPRD